MSAPELVGSSVIAGRYTVRSLLLHGGAMATYRAVGAKKREVVLKLYDPAILAFPDVSKTLAQHQSIGAKLPPHQIVPIAESGTEPNSGAPFTVTDFQSGASLAQLIDRGPLSASAMVVLVRNLARATDLLHSSGITSLSLHPANVFVGPDARYEVRVADFGASLVRSAIPAPEKARLWMPWLAPEQIKGQVPPAQAADIFAVALIAFFAVTGKRYWRSSQVKTPDTAALRREILGERMPASVRAGEFSISLNPAVDAVFARALAFRAADRYSTAREFAAGLDAALAGQSVAEADAAPVTGRVALPPPRKMPQRTTMLGMGSRAAVEPSGPSATAAAPRPPLTTMVGIGERVAEARAPAPAKATVPRTTTTPKIAPPAMTTVPAKASARATAAPTAVLAAPVTAVAPAISRAPMMPAATAISTGLEMPVAPAMSVEPPLVVPRGTTPLRGGPPPLPMAPPPAQMEEVLARFEAGPPDRLPETAFPESSMAGGDVVQAPPARPTAQHGDSGVDRVDTGVAVVGADFAGTPKKSRLRWVVGVCGLLVLTGGVAWALSGSTSGSRDRAASDAKVTATAAPPISTVPPSATVQPHAAKPAQQPTEETRTGTSLEPAAPEPAVQEPEAAERAAPAAEGNAATQPGGSVPSPTLVPHPQPSKKPCGKFLKRCK